MISASPDDYGFVQVERPILNGRDFLSQARQVGQNVLGRQVVSSISEFRLEDLHGDEFTRPVHVEVPTTEPLLRVCEDNDFNMVLLHRAAAHSEESRFSLAYVHQKLAASSTTQVHTTEYGEDSSRPRVRYKTEVPNLTDELDAIALGHDSDPDASHVTCDRLDVIGEPGSDIVLGLSPKIAGPESRMLHEQSKAAYRRLRHVSKRSATPISPWQVTAPFARIPGEVGDVDYGHLIESIEELLPVRVAVGGVAYSSRSGRPRNRQ